MTDSWLDSQSDADAANHAENFWSALRGDDDAGAFWADRIRQYRDDPGKRLRLAMDNLPLPRAFREAAVAIRFMIRSKRKVGENYEDELGLLYWLAAIESFMLEYAERLQEPGFNVVESMPGRLVRSLRIEYNDLGYEKLELLNKTDVKWLTTAWGQPRSHTTLNQAYRGLWDEYETKLIEKRRIELTSSMEDLRLLSKPRMQSPFSRLARFIRNLF